MTSMYAKQLLSHKTSTPESAVHKELQDLKAQITQAAATLELERQAFQRSRVSVSSGYGSISFRVYIVISDPIFMAVTLLQIADCRTGVCGASGMVFWPDATQLLPLLCILQSLMQVRRRLPSGPFGTSGCLHRSLWPDKCDIGALFWRVDCCTQACTCNDYSARHHSRVQPAGMLHHMAPHAGPVASSPLWPSLQHRAHGS